MRHCCRSEVPSAIEWFAHIDNPQTRRAYENDLHGFMQFAGIARPGGSTIRRKHAALSSLFEHLCESNAVTHNPVKGVKRPVVESQQGKTPALGDAQARALLSAPDAATLKGKRELDSVKARSAHSCMFFSVAGVAILQEFYGKEAMQVAGAAFYLIDGEGRNALSFATLENEQVQSTKMAFHAWVQCDDYISA